MKTIEEARRLLQSEEFMHIAAVLGGGEDLAEAYRNRLLCAIDSFVQLYGSGREIAIFLHRDGQNWAETTPTTSMVTYWRQASIWT
ncbi:MAG: hypothetical protein ACLR1R_04325 [Ruminococcus callidus]